MNYRDFHPEDVKAAIRKRFGSLTKFEIEHGLPRAAVNDLLRGRSSANTARLVNAVLVMEANLSAPRLTDISDNMPEGRGVHRLNRAVA